MGYAGNVEPSFILPTVVALNESFAKSFGAQGLGSFSGSAAAVQSAGVMADLDFFIGEEAISAARGGIYGLTNPIRHGQVGPSGFPGSS